MNILGSSLRRLVLACLVGAPVSAAWGDIVSLQPVADTSIFSLTPNNNWGGANFFNGGAAANQGINRGLVRFDLGGAVPPGSTIISATVSFEVIRQPSTGHRNSIFDLHRMLVSWGEGSQAPVPPQDVGLPAGAGEATWLHRFGDTDPWGQPGGQPGVDFVAAASANSFVGQVGDPVEFGPASGLTADVQWWLDNPGLNFGWMLSSQEENTLRTARSFASRESGFGPVLTIEFMPVPEPATAALCTLGGLALLAVVRRRS